MMNYFSKYRYAIWTIIVLGVIIITAIFTSLFFNYNRKPMSDRAGRFHNMGKMLHDELGLSPEQDIKFNAIHRDFFKVSHSIFMKLEDERILMVQELGKANPDTTLLYKLSDDMGILHALLKRETVNHLLRLRAICTPEQVQKLNILNKELIGPEGPMRRMGHRKHDSSELKPN